MPHSATSYGPEVEQILAGGKITAEGVLTLRRRVFLKGVVTEADAEMAFALNDRLGRTADPSWLAFFVEALTDYIVHQAEPHGYISEENADWLIARISRSSLVETETELELLVKVLEKAKLSPVKLVAFALEQVKTGVLDGEGYVGSRHKLERGIINAEEVELVRRILYAYGGDGNIAITQQEAAILFDINDETAETKNDPAWSDLFVKAIANFLMASSGYQVPPRQEALRREAWLDAPTPGVTGFLGQMLAGSLDAIWSAYEQAEREDETQRKTTSGGFTFGTEPLVTEAEARWAAERIGQDGRLHENEMALINFLKSHDAHLHPKLLPVLDRVAA